MPDTRLLTGTSGKCLVLHFLGYCCVFLVSINLELKKNYEDDTRTTGKSSFLQADFISLQSSIHTGTYIQEQGNVKYS